MVGMLYCLDEPMIEESAIQQHPLLRDIPRERLRVYESASSCTFWFTSSEHGEFSNMAEGFPLEVSGRKFHSAEALYQACRFPDHPEVQFDIAGAAFSKLAKNISRAHTRNTRSDWLAVRLSVMRWVLRVKAAQHKKDFLFSLSQTGGKPIVEETRKDPFWGAIRTDDHLIGINALGRLLMELRDEANGGRMNLMRIDPPNIPNFKLFGHDVGAVVPMIRTRGAQA